MVPQKRLFILLGGWFLVLVGVAFGLNFLLDLLPWMTASPLSGLLLAIPFVIWVYLPVPSLVKEGVFDGWKGFGVLAIWCAIFLLGCGAFLIFHLPSTLIIPLSGLIFVPTMVAAHQLRR